MMSLSKRAFVPMIALVTSRAFPDGSSDDALLADALRARGAVVSWQLWDDPSVAWNDFDLIVLRSCWDYHRRFVEFAAWLDERHAAPQRLVNSSSLVRWNLHKRYLLALGAAGMRIPATEIVSQHDERTLAAVMQQAGLREAVVKPAVSASAYCTIRVSALETGSDAAAAEAHYREMIQGGDVIVQAYLDAVVTAGEWSVVFFDGRLSHAVLKRAKTGEFRVQSEFGGSTTALTPPLRVVQGAERVLALLPERPAYLRIDGCMHAHRFVLMEAELIEPALFLQSSPGAASRFADALLAKQ